jgi:hypothetical protein
MFARDIRKQAGMDTINASLASTWWSVSMKKTRDSSFPPSRGVQTECYAMRKRESLPPKWVDWLACGDLIPFRGGNPIAEFFDVRFDGDFSRCRITDPKRVQDIDVPFRQLAERPHD